MSYCLMDIIREMQGLLRRGAELKRYYEILFISMPLYGLLVLLLLEEFQSILFYIVGFQLVIERDDFPCEPSYEVSRAQHIF